MLIEEITVKIFTIRTLGCAWCMCYVWETGKYVPVAYMGFYWRRKRLTKLPPLTEINFWNIKLFTDFPFICFDNLRFLWSQLIKFSFKTCILPPLGLRKPRRPHRSQLHPCAQLSVGKPEGKKPLGKCRRRREDNIKMDLKRHRMWGCSGFAGKSMNRRVPQNTGEFVDHLKRLLGFGKGPFLTGIFSSVI